MTANNVFMGQRRPFIFGFYLFRATTYILMPDDSDVASLLAACDEHFTPEDSDLRVKCQMCTSLDTLTYSWTVSRRHIKYDSMPCLATVIVLLKDVRRVKAVCDTGSVH